MVNKYIPKQGDLLYIDDISAIVISSDVFNMNTRMIMVCPIDKNKKNFPTHYGLEDSKKIKGVVLCEQIKSIDYTKSNLKYIEKASNNDLLSTIMLVNACIE